MPTPCRRISAPRLCLLAASAALALSVGCAPPAAVPPVSPGAVPPISPAAAVEQAAIEWGLVVHGGAGGRTPPVWTPAQRQDREARLGAALRAGHAILARGGSSLDAVEAVVAMMEDDPEYNAGRGAVFTADGRNELDAAIMDGPTQRAGAVAGLQQVKNPIVLARAVMERSEHVMMIGEGAERFAELVGVELVDPTYFFTQRAWDALERERAAERRRDTATVTPARPQEGAAADGFSYHGTVGAVALDRAGRLAAATSTGGRTNKRYGRVGDVPVIGAGTYANADCAASATGHGEFFIRYTAARDVCALAQHRGLGIAAAADSIIFGLFDPMQADGGVIALDRGGRLAMPFNTAAMPRGYIGSDGVPRVWLTR